MFGIVEGKKAKQLIEKAVVSKYGITSIYPEFTMFTKEKPGRHNNIIWPMVNGFFANAAVVAGNYTSFTNELNNLTHLALDEDKGNYNFWEIYNPYSGKPDGGYQVMGKENPNHHWTSCRYQTWSATAYINMVNYGLAGIRVGNNGISFSPFLPENIHYLQLNELVYRKAVLDILIKGAGKKIKSFSLNGKKQLSNSIDANIKGANKIVIELE
jgi:glycogen debranching enzyme